MYLANVKYGLIQSHFESDNLSLLANNAPDQITVAVLPDWAMSHRANNLSLGIATQILAWDYANTQFLKIDVVPNFTYERNVLLFKIRNIRNQILKATDFVTNTVDSPLDSANTALVVAYRSELRNVTDKPVLSDDSAYESYWAINKYLPKVLDLLPQAPSCIQSAVTQITSQKITISSIDANSVWLTSHPHIDSANTQMMPYLLNIDHLVYPSSNSN